MGGGYSALPGCAAVGVGYTYHPFLFGNVFDSTLGLLEIISIRISNGS